MGQSSTNKKVQCQSSSLSRMQNQHQLPSYYSTSCCKPAVSLTLQFPTCILEMCATPKILKSNSDDKYLQGQQGAKGGNLRRQHISLSLRLGVAPVCAPPNIKCVVVKGNATISAKRTQPSASEYAPDTICNIIKNQWARSSPCCRSGHDSTIPPPVAALDKAGWHPAEKLSSASAGLSFHYISTPAVCDQFSVTHAYPTVCRIMSFSRLPTVST